MKPACHYERGAGRDQCKGDIPEYSACGYSPENGGFKRREACMRHPRVRYSSLCDGPQLENETVQNTELSCRLCGGEVCLTI